MVGDLGTWDRRLEWECRAGGRWLGLGRRGWGPMVGAREAGLTTEGLGGGAKGWYSGGITGGEPSFRPQLAEALPVVQPVLLPAANGAGAGSSPGITARGIENKLSGARAGARAEGSGAGGGGEAARRGPSAICRLTVPSTPAIIHNQHPPAHSCAAYRETPATGPG